MQTKTSRAEKIDLRVSSKAKKVLRNAASVSRQSLSEFVLESAMAQADETLSARRSFTLDAKQWKAFSEALDAPPRETPRLKKLFKARGVFD